MHYYSFNIEHYTSHTARLSILEDIAYRRLLDLYYLNERPLDGCCSSVARDIGMVEHLNEVEYILTKFFVNSNDQWVNKRADIEIQFYHKQKKTASKAGKASAKARQVKASEQVSNDRSTTVQPISNHESVISNQQSLNTNQEEPLKEKTLVEQKPDDSEFEYLWVTYGKKGNRKTSLQKYNKLSKSDIALLKIHLPKYVKSTPDLQYRKGLQSYIEKECWNDEIIVGGNAYQPNQPQQKKYQEFPQ